MRSVVWYSYTDDSSRTWYKSDTRPRKNTNTPNRNRRVQKHTNMGNNQKVALETITKKDNNDSMIKGKKIKTVWMKVQALLKGPWMHIVTPLIVWMVPRKYRKAAAVSETSKTVSRVRKIVSFYNFIAENTKRWVEKENGCRYVVENPVRWHYAQSLDYFFLLDSVEQREK